MRSPNDALSLIVEKQVRLLQRYSDTVRDEVRISLVNLARQHLSVVEALVRVLLADDLVKSWAVFRLLVESCADDPELGLRIGEYVTSHEDVAVRSLGIAVLGEICAVRPDPRLVRLIISRIKDDTDP